jgi:hypothetical protein
MFQEAVARGVGQILAGIRKILNVRWKLLISPEIENRREDA